jgi:hypothetical protein
VLENPLPLLQLLHKEAALLDFFQHLLLVEALPLQLGQGCSAGGNFLGQVLLLLGQGFLALQVLLEELEAGLQTFSLAADLLLPVPLLLQEGSGLGLGLV